MVALVETDQDRAFVEAGLYLTTVVLIVGEVVAVPIVVDRAEGVVIVPIEFAAVRMVMVGTLAVDPIEAVKVAVPMVSVEVQVVVAVIQVVDPTVSGTVSIAVPIAVEEMVVVDPTGGSCCYPSTLKK